MRIRRIRPRAPAENMLPMINLVFLLLIFFLLAGVLRSPDPFAVAPPVSSSGTPAGERDAVLLIGREGRVAFEAVETGMEGLHEALSVRVARQPDLTVRLEADGRVPTPRVIEVMERMRAAGVKRLVLLTMRPEP